MFIARSLLHTINSMQKPVSNETSIDLFRLLLCSDCIQIHKRYNIDKRMT